ncbi:MAG: hypothetical protein LBW85_09720 [Deltaproteobacteria bacterium]|jgi:hypothetical protein|nr:hypothetical protein [Deltaproteobacteria bacterium]
MNNDDLDDLMYAYASGLAEDGRAHHEAVRVALFWTGARHGRMIEPGAALGLARRCHERLKRRETNLNPLKGHGKDISNV